MMMKDMMGSGTKYKNIAMGIIIVNWHSWVEKGGQNLRAFTEPRGCSISIKRFGPYLPSLF